MDIKESIEEATKALSQILDPDILAITKKSFLKNAKSIQKVFDEAEKEAGDPDATFNALVEKESQGMSPEEKKNYREMLAKIFYDGLTVGEALGFSLEELDAIYYLAQEKYNHGLYPVAESIFFILTLWDQEDPRHDFGYAASLHMQKKYKEAIVHYYNCIGKDPHNPISWFHLADCFMQLEDYRDAGICLMIVKRMAGGIEELSELIKKTELMVEAISAKYEEKLEAKGLH